jgi:hypothetical protein
MKKTNSRSVIFASIVLGGMATLSLFGFIYLLYKSYVLHAPLNFKLFALSIFGLLLFVSSLFLRDSRKINIAVFVCSALIAAYGVEAVLFLHYKSRTVQRSLDSRNKLEVLEDMRNDGVDAWPHVLASLFVESNGLLSGNNQIFPLGGISDKTVVYCNESGQYKLFNSDEHGFNNPKGLYREGAVNTVLVGDSFAIGSCVKSEEEVGTRLRKHGLHLLNLGNGGNGPLIELAVLEEYAAVIEPEIILWLYFEGNDLSDLQGERASSMLMRYLKDAYSQNLIERQSEIDSVLMDYVETEWLRMATLTRMRNVIQNMPIILRDNLDRENKLKPLQLWHIRDRIGLINVSDNQKREVSFSSQLELFSDVIAEAYRRASGWGGKFYFIYLPEMERYFGKNDDGAFFDRAGVLSIVHDLGIPVIDFHDVLKSHTDPLSLTPFLGAHYNAEGYRLLAELIVGRLTADGYMPDNDDR